MDILVVLVVANLVFFVGYSLYQALFKKGPKGTPPK
jgi:hypothetical protein